METTVQKKKTTELPWEAHGRLEVSPDGRYFQYADGTPFIWMGETAWAVHQNLSREDVIMFLDDTHAKGFTVVQLMSVNSWALNDMKNYYGDKPYDNPAEPNPAYWNHVGWVIDEAGKRGMHVLLVIGTPLRDDKKHGAVLQTLEETYRYGYVLGEMYRDKPNLIWSNGIDVNPDNWKAHGPCGFEGWHALAEGVFDGVSGTDNYDGHADWDACLMTYHNAGARSSGDWFHHVPWERFNGAQLGFINMIPRLAEEYRRRPAKPFVNLEPFYEGCTWERGSRKTTDPVDDWEVRVQAFQTLFTGACGHTYGHWNIYPFDRTDAGLTTGSWRDVLDAPGRQQVKHIRAFMEMMPVPAGVPVEGFVTDPPKDPSPAPDITTYVPAMGTPDGKGAYVYLPQGGSVTADLAQLKTDTAQVSWFDPKTGECAAADPVKADGPVTFTSPGGSGTGNDRVLVLTSG